MSTPDPSLETEQTTPQEQRRLQEILQQRRQETSHRHGVHSIQRSNSHNGTRHKLLLPIREHARKRRERDRERVEELLQQYDVNNSGQLEFTQLKSLLSDITFSTTKAVPSDEVVLMVLRKADPSGYYEASSIHEASCHRSHLLEALSYYRSYIRNQHIIDRHYAKYDWDHSGELDGVQLKALMIDMAPHEAVTDADVAWLMHECDKNESGGISKHELLATLGIWSKVVSNKKAKIKRSLSLSSVCVVS